MKSMEEMSKKELLFLDQMTRKYMVEWCAFTLMTEHLPLDIATTKNPYFRYALHKKWISADRTKILSSGWETAARFLKR